MSNLVIPTGDREMVVMHTGTYPNTVKATLRISVDGSIPVSVGVEPDGDENTRARRAVVLLTGIHMVFHGEVTVFDLDDDTIRDILEDAA